jgi:hypothetical protein
MPDGACLKVVLPTLRPSEALLKKTEEEISKLDTILLTRPMLHHEIKAAVKSHKRHAEATATASLPEDVLTVLGGSACVKMQSDGKMMALRNRSAGSNSKAPKEVRHLLA